MGPTWRRRTVWLTRVEHPSGQRRLHGLPAGLDDAAVAGDEAVSGEPRAEELDVLGDPLVVDDGAVAGGRGQLGDADVVVVVGRSARGGVEALGRR